MDHTILVQSALFPPVSAATRLCTACGLCCNGVLFHLVQLQPQDSRQALLSLGLKLKRKRKKDLLLQPCPAFCGSSCSIYEARPERCRLFECRQLQKVASGEISEAEALEKIQLVQGKVAELHRQLDLAGLTNERRPLSKRCEKILAEPALEEISRELQDQIRQGMAELDAILDADFRVLAPHFVG